MRIHILAAGTRQPDWVNAGFQAYARRLPRECRLTLTEFTLARRRKNEAPSSAIADEGRRLLAAIPASAAVLRLDPGGQAWSTPELAEQLSAWLADGRDRWLLIGGPDGLAPACAARAETAWSLSPLTLPHGLARVLTAEALYRAWSLLAGHPYHRG